MGHSGFRGLGEAMGGSAAATGGAGADLLDHRYEHQCGSMFVAAASGPPVHPCGSRAAWGSAAAVGAGGAPLLGVSLPAVSETCPALAGRLPRGSEQAGGRAGCRSTSGHGSACGPGRSRWGVVSGASPI